jgi:hypothetical protein
MPTAFQQRALDLSGHALSRAQQRGVRRSWIELLLGRFDVERPVGDGCHAISCSRRALAQAIDDGVAPGEIERLARLVLIVASDGTVVTVMNYQTAFARYQRGHASLSSRERARMAERRRRGGNLR